MNLLRGYSIIKKDGINAISATYNVVDERGNIVDLNRTTSFYVTDQEAQEHIAALDAIVKERVNEL